MGTLNRSKKPMERKAVVNHGTVEAFRTFLLVAPDLMKEEDDEESGANQSSSCQSHQHPEEAKLTYWEKL